MSNVIEVKKYLANASVRERVESLLKDRAGQFITTVTAMVNANSKLAECEPNSLITSALTATALNLPINQSLGFAWIIPYKSKDGNTYAQFQMGYKGFVQLAMRSGEFKKLDVVPVYEGDTDESVMTRLNSIITPEPPSDKITGYVAYMKLINGFEKTLYMTSEELKRHATRFSKSYTSKFASTNLWKDDFDAMAKKTVIKLLLSRYAPMNTDMIKAQESDQAVLLGDGQKYIDNESQTTEEKAEEKEVQRLEDYINKCTSLEELQICQEAVYQADNTNLFDLYADKRKELEKKNAKS